MKNKKDILKEAIELLEHKQAHEMKELKAQFHLAYESLKPINLIRNTLNEVEASPQIKSDTLRSAVGLATGYLSKRVLTGENNKPLKQVLGTLFQFAVDNVVLKNADTIIATGETLVKHMFKPKNKLSEDKREAYS